MRKDWLNRPLSRPHFTSYCQFSTQQHTLVTPPTLPQYTLLQPLSPHPSSSSPAIMLLHPTLIAVAGFSLKGALTSHAAPTVSDDAGCIGQTYFCYQAGGTASQEIIDEGVENLCKKYDGLDLSGRLQSAPGTDVFHILQLKAVLTQSRLLHQPKRPSHRCRDCSL